MKIKIQHLAVLFFTLTNLGLAEAQTQNKFNEKMTSLIKSYKLNPSHFSMEIKDGSQSVSDLNAKTKLIPASISKIATAYSTLIHYPYNHKFKTQLCQDSKNLYLVGGGDPGFVSENMWYLVNEYVRQNKKTIDGDIIVDDSLFDRTKFDDSRQSKRTDRSYDAPVGAMSFNWNSINIFVKPIESENRIQVYLDPENDYFTLKNNVKVSSKKNENNVIVDVNQSSRTITVSGSVSLSQKEKPYYMNVNDPTLWSGLNLKSFLKQRGITVQGSVKGGKLPAKADCVVSVDSKSIFSLVMDMNKFSNNFVAEMLTKNLAAYDGEIPATLKLGVDKINADLSNLGLSKSDFVLLNPSGFTRDNQFSAHAMNVILTKIKNDFKLFPSFVESLPSAGLDGTLKNRMKNTAATGYVRAKTGYLDGVVTLAGYAGDDKGKVYTFTFIYNGPGDEAQVRKLMDSILISLLES